METALGLEFGDRVRSRSDTYYHILHPVGSGGNSVVYVALALNKSAKGVVFALKVFTRLTKRQRLERFYKETDFLRHRCDHPSIMRVFDEGVYAPGDGDSGVEYPFVVAEHLVETLGDYMQKPTDMVERVSHCLQLLSALTYLDSLPDKVVHRDIKPQNIFVKAKSCVLGDFGLMKFTDDDPDNDLEFYEEGTSHGMPFHYRSPDLVEYANGNTVLTTKSDVFQLGLVFAELFTGENPEKRAAKITDPVELSNLGHIAGNKGKQIRDLIGMMLEMDSAKRLGAAEIIDIWEGLFREVAEQGYQLNGRVF